MLIIWHLLEVRDIEDSVNSFNLVSNRLEANSLRLNQINKSDFISRNSTAESIITKLRELKISYSELVYFYKLIKKINKSMSQIAFDSNVRIITLYTIKKEMDKPFLKIYLKTQLQIEA